MAKGKNCILVILCLLTLSGAFGQRVLDSDSLREEIAKTYLSEVGVKEATGNNDGPRIEEYIATAGLDPKGHFQWCACFAYWCYFQHGIILPVSGPAWTPSYFTEGSIIWDYRRRYNQKPKKADIIGMYIPSKGRIGHVGFFHEEWGDFFITVEGNVNNQVAIRKRRKIQIRYVARFVK